MTSEKYKKKGKEWILKEIEYQGETWVRKSELQSQAEEHKKKMLKEVKDLCVVLHNKYKNDVKKALQSRTEEILNDIEKWIKINQPKYKGVHALVKINQLKQKHIKRQE